MTSKPAQSSDPENFLKDLSGVDMQLEDNPYNGLIRACGDRLADIQAVYSTHRTRRNAQQRERFLSQDFTGVLVDSILARLEDANIEPGFRDSRHSLVFWARPPNCMLELAQRIQAKLKVVSPGLWLMPTHRMHMTTLEITHSRTATEISGLVNTLRPVIPAVAGYTFAHRARLEKPMLSYDLAGVALSFLPADGRPTDAYTYHHLRRDVFELARSSGIEVESRYVVPSAHITLGRFITGQDHATSEQRQAWIRAMEEINDWLESNIWGRSDGADTGEWPVGLEKGLDVREGALWYGGGRTLLLGEGF